MAVLLSFLILNGSSVIYQSSFATEAAAATEYEHKMKWGSKGVATGQFNQAGGIAADSENNIYVADFTGRSNMIQKFTNNGSYILGFGVLGNGPQFFTNPSGLAVDSDNNIYIADFG
ncbi:MAG: 6-bladed beta-propeller, partial [Nitrososphaeraceae archaeon]